MAGFGAQGPALERQIRTLERKYRARAQPCRKFAQDTRGPLIQSHRAAGARGIEGAPHLRPGMAGQDQGARGRLRRQRRQVIARGGMKRAARGESRFPQ